VTIVVFTGNVAGWNILQHSYGPDILLCGFSEYIIHGYNQFTALFTVELVSSGN
jgi:hypothetical protein